MRDSSSDALAPPATMVASLGSGGKCAALAIAALFAIVHGLYFAAGVRFDERPLGYFYQYLDPDLLLHDLPRSLFYLHAQPPLFNLFLGVVLKLFPRQHALVFAILFLLAGLVLCLALFALLRRLGVSWWIAAVLATAFTASPDFVLQEQCLTYAVPAACLITLAALALERALGPAPRGAATMFFGLLLILCGTWSLFHMAYFVLLLAGLVAFAPRKRAVWLRASLVPAVLLVALYAKNLVLFGHFAPSTWVGMNLARITLRRLPPLERARLRAEAVVSPLARIRPFAPLTHYPAEYQAASGFENVPAVSRPFKTNGAPNFNHVGYVRISEQYLRDSLATARLSPRAYLEGLGTAWIAYFEPAGHSGFLEPNIRHVSRLAALYDRIVYGRLPEPELRRQGVAYHLHLFLLLGLPGTFAFGLWTAWRARAEQRVLLLYMSLTIAWVAFVGNSLDVGENNRFRLATDPLSLALLGLLLERLLASARRAAARTSRPETTEAWPSQDAGVLGDARSGAAHTR